MQATALSQGDSVSFQATNYYVKSLEVILTSFEPTIFITPPPSLNPSEFKSTVPTFTVSLSPSVQPTIIIRKQLEQVEIAGIVIGSSTIFWILVCCIVFILKRRNKSKEEKTVYVTENNIEDGNQVDANNKSVHNSNVNN
jgi:hypothetical protein